MNKEKMIDRMEEAKDIVRDVWAKTNVDKVGDVLWGSIDEAVNAIEEEEEKEEKE